MEKGEDWAPGSVFDNARWLTGTEVGARYTWNLQWLPAMLGGYS